MKLGFQGSVLLAFFSLTVSACYFGVGSDSEPTFNVAFDAPDGSGSAGGNVDREFRPIVLQDFDLPAGVAVAGQVTDSAGAPLQHVDVSFRRTATSPDLDRDETDATGNYSVTLPAGTWVAVLQSQEAPLGTMTVTGVSVTVAATRDFRFPATVVIPGVVYEADGVTPVVGADLEFTGTTTGATGSVTTNGLGRYSVSLVPDTYDIVATPAGAVATTHVRQRFTVFLSGAKTRDFTLTRGVQISGTVRRSIGTPLGDTGIAIELPEDSGFFSPVAVTSSPDGSYSIPLVPPGPLTFALEPPGDSGFPRQTITRTIYGPTTQIEDLTLAPGVVLRGTVLKEDGVTPEPHVEVRVIPLEGSPPPLDTAVGETDGAGRYAVSVFRGFYEVHIIPDPVNRFAPEIRYFPVMIDLVLNVTLSPGVTLTGVVTEPGSATPAGSVRVSIPALPETFDVTDAGGTYSLLAPVGTHTLEFAAEDGPLEHILLDPLENVDVAAPGPVTRDITLSVSTTGSQIVQGTVYAPDGITPAAGVEVTVTDNQTGDVLGVAVTDASGEYLIVLAP